MTSGRYSFSLSVILPNIVVFSSNNESPHNIATGNPLLSETNSLVDSVTFYILFLFLDSLHISYQLYSIFKNLPNKIFIL